MKSFCKSNILTEKFLNLFPIKFLNLCSQNYALTHSTMKKPGELYAVKQPKKQRFSHESLGFSKMDIPKMSIFSFSKHFSLEIINFRIQLLRNF